MSKAFTKETDHEHEEDDEDKGPAIPAGSKNYITPAGAKRLQEELYQLKYKVRPEYTNIVQWAASLGDRSENADYLYGKKKLREIDKRMRYIGKRLDNIAIIDPTLVKSDQVVFGATVTIRDEDDTEKTYSIVGVDEVNVEQGRISWVSPLANALFKARVDDYVTFKSPKGVREIEIVKIEYKSLDDE